MMLSLSLYDIVSDIVESVICMSSLYDIVSHIMSEFEFSSLYNIGFLSFMRLSLSSRDTNNKRNKVSGM